jgi:xylulokinase
MSHTLGLDLGTTGVKVLAVAPDGEIVASASEEYPLYHPEVGWSEQDPADWWAGTTAAVESVLADPAVDADAVDAVGLTGQMHGSVFLDEAGEVLRPAILWNDTRTTAQCERIHETVGEERLLELASNPAFEGFTAPKILWVQANEPGVFERTDRILLPKDYLRYRLTDGFATDVSDASGTLLLDVGERDWSAELLEALEIPRSTLPEVYESPEVTGTVTEAAAEATGLPAGTPVVAGAGDNAAGAVGTGVIGDGDAWGSIGTSGVVFVATDEELTDPGGRAHTFCHAVPGMWHVMGVMLAAGGAFRWFADTLGGPEAQVAEFLDEDDQYDLLTREAASVEPGSEGLVFLPYIDGERTPHRDADARGVFFGLSSRHEKPHLVRSVMEGVTYGLRDSLGIVRELGVEVTELKASGGGAKSPLWRQIQADVLDADILTPAVDEGPAYGAALLAGVGAGTYPDVETACERAVAVTERVEPDDTARRVYDEYYEVFRSLYPALEESFGANADALAAAQDLLEG